MAGAAPMAGRIPPQSSPLKLQSSCVGAGGHTQSCRADCTDSAWCWPGRMLWGGDWAICLRGESSEPPSPVNHRALSQSAARAEAGGAAGRGDFVDGLWVRVAVWWLGIRLRLYCLGWALVLRLSCSAHPLVLSLTRLPRRPAAAHASSGRALPAHCGSADEFRSDSRGPAGRRWRRRVEDDTEDLDEHSELVGRGGRDIARRM